MKGYYWFSLIIFCIGYLIFNNAFVYHFFYHKPLLALIGLFIMIVSLVFYLVKRNSPSEQSYDKTELSTSLTFIYKCIFMAVVFLGSLCNTIGMLIYYPGELFSGYLFMEITVVFFGIALIPLFFLNELYYDDKYLHINSFIKSKIIELTQIQRIRSFPFALYKVYFYDKAVSTRSVLFMAHTLYSFGFSKPRTIKAFEEKLQNKKKDSTNI